MKKLPLCILVWACCISALTLPEAYRAAGHNAPVSRLPSVIAESRRLTLKTLDANYLPSVSLSGKWTRQSEPTVPIMDKDSYSLVGEASQILWDGGATRAQKTAIQSASAVESTQNQVDLFALKTSVNRAYFSILIADEQLELNEARSQDLTRRLEQVKSQILAGVADETNRAIVEVELLKLGQNRQELYANRSSGLLALQILTGLSLQDSVRIEIPEEMPVSGDSIERPELLLFKAQEHSMQSEKAALDAKLMPRFSVFGQLGYGKPGIVMSQPNADTWWLVGGRVYWDLSMPLLTRSAQLAKISANQEKVDIARQSFLQANRSQIAQKQVEIAKLDSLLATDQKLIELRKVIRIAAEAKVNHGAMTVTDLLSRCDDEESAKMALAQHRVQKIQAIWDLRVLFGNDNAIGQKESQ